jgi:hypothetical protein
MRVTTGLGPGCWIVARGRHRVKSPALPPRSTRAQCQADLNAYAARKGWRRVDEGIA